MPIPDSPRMFIKKADNVTKPVNDNNSINIYSFIQEFERNKNPIAMFDTLKTSPTN